MKKQNITKIVSAIVFLIALGLGSWWLVVNNEQAKAPQAQTQETVRNQESSKLTISEDGTEVSYNGQDGKTALAVVQGLTEVVTEDTQYGAMVMAINGLKSESGKNYWALYVNEEYANEGAGTLQTKSTDKLVWKLEKIVQ